MDRRVAALLAMTDLCRPSLAQAPCPAEARRQGRDARSPTSKPALSAGFSIFTIFPVIIPVFMQPIPMGTDATVLNPQVLLTPTHQSAPPLP